MNVRFGRPRAGTMILAAVAAALAAALIVVLPRPGDAESPGGSSGVGRLPDHLATSASGADCRNYLFDVETDLGAHQLFGQWCVPESVQESTPVQVLLHGGAYDRRYWDWPYQPEEYSYVKQATDAGYATLNLDRLGYGLSSRPDPAGLDFAVGGQAVHEVVERLRGGELGHRFDTVVLNGHSMGGLVAEEAAALGGVDAVIVSGIAPDVDASGGDGGPPSDGGEPDGGPPSDGMYPFYPAEDDPKFAGEPWAPGYLTTQPGSREEFFLYPGTFDPAAAVFEEVFKDTLADAELAGVRPDEPGEGREAAGSGVPTAFVLGEHDVIACADADCAADPDVQSADLIVEDSAHSINVTTAAGRFYDWTFEWLAEQGFER